MNTGLTVASPHAGKGKAVSDLLAQLYKALLKLPQPLRARRFADAREALAKAEEIGDRADALYAVRGGGE